MDQNIFRFIIIPVVVITFMSLIKFVRTKLAKPDYTDELQRPGAFDRFLAMVIKIIAVLSAFFMFLGVIMGEMEMAIVFSVLTLVFFGIVVLLNHKLDTSYYENSDFFILNSGKKEYKVHYENIVDWQPSFKEIKIVDESRGSKESVNVNIDMFTPEILLRKIADKTFDGQFDRLDSIDFDDPKREHEIIQFLVQNNYGYLVEDYIERGY